MSDGISEVFKRNQKTLEKEVDASMDKMNEITIQKLDNEIKQLKEKVETLSHQKHSLEQTNIGLQRDLKRAEKESEQYSQVYDLSIKYKTQAEEAEIKLDDMRLKIWKLIDKYILEVE